MHNDDPQGARQRIFARLAVLQRLEDEARSGQRPAMLQSIRQLMDHELAALHAIGALPPAQPGLASYESPQSADGTRG